ARPGAPAGRSGVMYSRPTPDRRAIRGEGTAPPRARHSERLTPFGLMVISISHYAMIVAAARLLADSGDPTPLYFRLKTLLTRGIESLAHPPGSRLPSERSLAD